MKNADQPDFNTVLDLSKLADEDAFTVSVIGSEEFAEWLKRAQNYLLGYRWARSIQRNFIGYVEPGILAVFLFKIEPEHQDVDPWIWVIVGDLPSAYIPCFEITDPWSALDGYLYEMERWSDAVLRNGPLDNLFPVDADATTLLAESLKDRISLIRDKILPNVPRSCT